MQFSFGERLLVLRRRCKLSQAQLAAQVGCAQNDIWRMEHGFVENPGVERMVQLAKALGVSVEELWTGKALEVPAS